MTSTKKNVRIQLKRKKCMDKNKTERNIRNQNTQPKATTYSHLFILKAQEWCGGFIIT